MFLSIYWLSVVGKHGVTGISDTATHEAVGVTVYKWDVRSL